MSTALTPYREPALVVAEVEPEPKTGLILPVEKHLCNKPFKYEITSVKKYFFFFTKKVVKIKDVPDGALFRCHQCLKIYQRTGGYWECDYAAIKKWNEATGDNVPVEPFPKDDPPRWYRAGQKEALEKDTYYRSFGVHGKS